MDEYINKCTLAVNGKEVTDFKSFTENERVLSKTINLMNKTGKCKMTPRYGFNLEYLVPLDADEFDFESVEDGVVTVDYGNGRRVIYTGVDVLTIGEEKVDGENELVKTITFGAGNRRKE